MDRDRIEDAVVALIEAVGTTDLRVTVRTYVTGRTAHYRVGVGDQVFRFERRK